MHPRFAKADRLAGELIGAAIEVQRIMGQKTVQALIRSIGHPACLLIAEINKTTELNL
jgi:hypothetical protein